MRNIILSDVTIKTCAEAGSQQLTFKEKLETARLLDGLNVPVIELPKIAHERADSLLIKSIAGILNNSVLSVDAGLTKDSIEMTWEALKEAKNPRLSVQVSLSSARMEYVYRMKADGMKQAVEEAVKCCVSLTDDVEFVAEDATRTDFTYLAEVLEVVIAGGASTITLNDTAGTMLPVEYEAFLKKLYEEVPALKNVKLGAAFKNDLNLAEALAVTAVSCGASEIKVSAADLNTVSLTAFAVLLKEKQGYLQASSEIRVSEINRTVRNIARLIQNKDQGNSPFDDGVREYSEDISYDVHDTMEEVMKGVQLLGYELTESDKMRVYNAFKNIASRKESVGIRELEVIIASEAMQVPDTYTLVNYMVTTGNAMDIVAHLKLKYGEEILDGLSLGDGPVDAAFLAIEKITGTHYELDDFQIQSITEGREAMGQTIVKLRSGGLVYSGMGLSTDIIGSAILAYINALNKIVYEEA